MSDERVVAQECYQQSDQLRRNGVERIGPIRFQWCSSMSCRASGRRGVLGIALMWTTCGKVYNGISDDDTHDDTLNLSIVHLLWCWGTGGLSCRRTRASGRFSCFLVHASLVVLVFVTRTKF